MPESIRILPIGRLSRPGPEKVSFRIPAYQRGYRWKKADVTRLLADLKEFLDEGDEGRQFYCLQPLVVKKAVDEHDKPEHWEVVDGQQRLTTLFLLWKYLNDKPPYELVYETRKHSEGFLNAPAAEENGRFPNIDFHHIYHAHLAILEWFSGAENERERFRKLLADSDPAGRNVRIIWYEIGAEDDAVAAFTRLNVGKIPLTDEELVRALFLRNQKCGNSAEGAFQHRLALEWDRIETSLQEPDFWGFVSNQTDSEGGRIRLLFELCAPEGISTADHGIFHHYEEKLRDVTPERLRAEWQHIVSCFEQLQEWHRDPEFFHLVGFATTILSNKSVLTLRRLLGEVREQTKSCFAGSLRKSIRTRLVRHDLKLQNFVSELDYDDRQETLQTLALFNITTLLRTEGNQSRFPFHLYHGNHWDIEHVQSQAGDGLGDEKRQLEWLKSCEDELVKEAGPDSRQIRDQIRQFRDKHPGLAFKSLEGEIRRYFEERDSNESLHGIGNLTLLDRSTNRAYGNAPFVVKRSKVLEADRKGRFILPCTRDLFLKVFSQDPGNLRRWDIEKDGAEHEMAICEALETFFGEKGEGKS